MMLGATRTFVSPVARSGALDLTRSAILVDKADHEGVKIAANFLSEDLSRATQTSSQAVQLYSGKDEVGESHNDVRPTIIIGCIESSRLLQKLEQAGKVDFTAIRGKWETFYTSVVDGPVEGINQALVIAGSDKRGAIFGIYTFSEQIGVSPWYWWADVPPKHHPNLYALPTTTISGEPSIRYRGIFINDEAPALTGWVREKFGGYNVEFYKKVFELLLRLRANFLWPAMWPGFPNPGASFFTDDPENQRTADIWGIVVSTSHHEPMQRMANEWLAENPLGTWDWLTNKEKITEFFRIGTQRAKGLDSYFTMGMRGEYDTTMRAEDPAAIVQDVLHTQRSLIKDLYGREDAVPQLLALYKEVQVQYDSGNLDVPEDVTLLFADDNFGSIRRLPREDEKKRKGGAGIYYHFEYVGTPRSYKWINSNSLGKTWHQLKEAHRRGARQIWVFNVGDIKPLEVPITFAMRLAWNIDSIEAGGIPAFLQDLASDQFGQTQGENIAKAWYEHDRLVSLRRHEHIEPSTFSLLHYDEADGILGRWSSLLTLAETIHARSMPDQKAAIFQLVLHPIKASATFFALQITLGKNQLYGIQRRTSTNLLADRVLELLDADFDIAEEYHALVDGKWNQMMCQPHYGFGDTWHAPSRDMISGLCYVQRRQKSNPIVGHMGIMVEGHSGVRPGFINENSDFTHPSQGDLVPGVTLGEVTRYGPHRRWVELFTRGPQVVHWTAKAPHIWVKLSREEGVLVPGEEDQRVEVEVIWEQAPPGLHEVLIEVGSKEGDFEHIHLPVNGREIPQLSQNSFIEADGYVSIPATAALGLHSTYRVLPDTGRLPEGSVTLDPACDVTISKNLEYLFFVFTDPAAAARVSLIFYFNMTLDFDPGNPMSYEFAIDHGPVHQARLLEVDTEKGDPELPSPGGWLTAVQDCVWRKEHDVRLDLVGKGEHVLHIRLLHTNIILEKIVLDFGGAQNSYLGPPPSYHASSI